MIEQILKFLIFTYHLKVKEIMSNIGLTGMFLIGIAVKDLMSIYIRK